MLFWSGEAYRPYATPEGGEIPVVEPIKVTKILDELSAERKTIEKLKKEKAALAYQCADLQRGGVDALKEPARSWFVDRDAEIDSLKKALAVEKRRLDWLDQNCAFVADDHFKIGPFKTGELRKMAGAGLEAQKP